MKSREFKELLDKFSMGECSPEEEKLIQDWYENIGGAHHERRVESDSRNSLEAKLWWKISPRSSDSEKTYSYYLTRIAAAILLLALAGLGAYVTVHDRAVVKPDLVSLDERTLVDGTITRISNDETSPSEITLEDGSSVTLKPRSEIQFVKKFSTERREVYLSGEAFFNVKRDTHRPFLVYSNEVVTQVLGTSFNIKAYENEKEITVAVKSGKVSVYPNPRREPVTGESSHEAVILSPNQKMVYNRRNEKVVKQLVEDPQIILPQSNLFKMSFDEVPVTKIFKVLEENYGVDIVYDEEALKRCTLTTAMSDEGLYQRIEVICKAIKAEYTVTDAVIFIKSRGCE